MTSVEGYFFDDPGYWHSHEEKQPPYIQGFKDLLPEVAAINGLSLATARIEHHMSADKAEVGEEGEQS